MITEQIRVEQNAELNLASLWNDHAFFNYVIHTWPISGKIMQSMIAWLSWIFLSPLFTELLSQHFRVQAEAFNIFWFFFWLKNGYVWCRFNSRKIRPTVFLRALMNDFIKTHTHTLSTYNGSWEPHMESHLTSLYKESQKLTWHHEVLFRC